MPSSDSGTSGSEQKLFRIKLLHTVVWAFFVACILSIPALALLDELGVAAILCGVVLVEVLVLVANRWSCPLTPVAARYTDDRSANFDIFLPEALARHNKTIFGALYVGGLVIVVLRWLDG